MNRWDSLGQKISGYTTTEPGTAFVMCSVSHEFSTLAGESMNYYLLSFPVHLDANYPGLLGFSVLLPFPREPTQLFVGSLPCSLDTLPGH